MTPPSDSTERNLAARDLADVTVLDTQGETYRLGDAWSEKPAILVFVRVTLAAHGPKNAKKFRDLVEETDEIQEAHMLAGDADYLLKVIVKDLAALSDLVNGVLLAHDSVARVRSDIVLDSLKEEGRLPIHPEEART